MSEKVFCRNCYKPFTPKRDDAKFCSDKCAAAWARENGYERERFHAEKPEWLKKNCEWCQTIFEYNEYALRGGERVPKFCSNKCRQASYRARKAAEGQPAGYTGNWDDARNDKTHTKGTSQNTGKEEPYARQNDDGEWEYNPNYKGKGTQQPNGDNKGTSQGKENKGTQQTPPDKRWTSKDPYEILGVLRTSNHDTIKRVWRKLLRTYHPDSNKETNAEFISKRVNWAWDKIENPNARSNRR